MAMDITAYYISDSAIPTLDLVTARKSDIAGIIRCIGTLCETGGSIDLCTLVPTLKKAGISELRFTVASDSESANPMKARVSNIHACLHIVVSQTVQEWQETINSLLVLERDKIGYQDICDGEGDELDIRVY